MNFSSYRKIKDLFVVVVGGGVISNTGHNFPVMLTVVREPTRGL